VPVRRSRFEQPVSPQRRKAANRFEQFSPLAGVNYDNSPQQLPHNESPLLQNFYIHDHYIQPRSGLSQWQSASLNAAGVVQMVVSDQAEYGQALVVRSDASHHILTAGPLSGGGGSQITFNAPLPVHPAAVAFSSNHTRYVVFAGNSGFTYPLLAVDTDSTGNRMVFSDLGEAALGSVVQVRGGCVEFDERLVVFNTISHNTASDYTTYNPTRVQWTARADPTNFAGGGFEDVPMRGTGVSMAVENNRLLLFTDRQIWVATPRRDAYAFDFNLLDQELGAAHPTTVIPTPDGTFFYGSDNLLHRVVSNQVKNCSIGAITKLASISSTSVAFGVHNMERNSYMLFYSSSADSFADSALEFRIDRIRPVTETNEAPAWEAHQWPDYRFGHAVSLQSSIGSVTATGDVVLLNPLPPSLVLGSADGILYRLLSTQTTDGTSAVTALWDSPAVASRYPLGNIDLNEVWLEAAPSSSTATAYIWTSTDRGVNFTGHNNVVLSPTTSLQALPVVEGASHYAQARVQINDGSRPQLSKMVLRLRDYTGRFRG